MSNTWLLNKKLKISDKEIRKNIAAQMLLYECSYKSTREFRIIADQKAVIGPAKQNIQNGKDHDHRPVSLPEKGNSDCIGIIAIPDSCKAGDNDHNIKRFHHAQSDIMPPFVHNISPFRTRNPSSHLAMSLPGYTQKALLSFLPPRVLSLPA